LEGAFEIQLMEVRPGRNSIIRDMQTVGIAISIAVSSDLPDFWYRVQFQVVDSQGNNLPTQWFQGGGGGSIRPGGKKDRIDYFVPADPARPGGIPGSIPAIGITYIWARNENGFSGYLFNNVDQGMQTNIPVNWHR
jgi:hypothetical protein